MSTQGVVPPKEPLDALPLLAGALAGVLLGARRDLSRRHYALATAGALGLIGWALTRALAGARRRGAARSRRAEVRLSFVVAHPVERVFGFLRDFENYPRLMRAIEGVRDHGDGRSHWCASTAAGERLEWDTVTTKYVPNRVIAWRSVPGAAVAMNGLVRLVPETPGTTCLSIAICLELLQAEDSHALVTPSGRAPGEALAADLGRLGAVLDAETAAVSTDELPAPAPR